MTYYGAKYFVMAKLCHQTAVIVGVFICDGVVRAYPFCFIIQIFSQIMFVWQRNKTWNLQMLFHLYFIMYTWWGLVKLHCFIQAKTISYPSNWFQPQMNTLDNHSPECCVSMVWLTRNQMLQSHHWPCLICWNTGRRVPFWSWNNYLLSEQPA